ncbi:MAG: hypothetical protein KDE62_15790, partial [Calditrichaeota bacterium]|nr:hypothetical protein [Calditrichota bacterium]
MRTDPQHLFIRIQLLQNANFGAASGKVTLDRPTQVDAYLELPFIPNSTLRGVLRNQIEWYPDAHQNANVMFGDRLQTEEAPETFEENKPGKLIIGNGDPLAFPVLSTDGRRCWIFPYFFLGKFLMLETLSGITTDLSRIGKAIYQADQHYGRIIALSEAPPLEFSRKVELIRPGELMEELDLIRTTLGRWIGRWLPSNEPWLIVDDRTATALWQEGVEIRDQTALDEHMVARDQSLRRIETIPEGTLFLSWLSWFGEGDLALAPLTLQLGSGEGRGSGFCRIAPLADLPDNNMITSTPAASGGQELLPIITDSEAMVYVYKAIQELQETPDYALQKKLRSAIGDLGWRIKSAGLETALSFALAKAKPAKQTPKTEQLAYRWLLETLLNTSDDLNDLNGQPWFSSHFTEAEKINLMRRWQWLRKYGEGE